MLDLDDFGKESESIAVSMAKERPSESEHENLVKS
jgi:hypothetical protein